MLIEHPGFYGVVAEQDGRISGSNFIDLRSIIAGIEPITVDPATQDRGVGRRLMQAVMAPSASMLAFASSRRLITTGHCPFIRAWDLPHANRCH
jgi:ribosomal protein S18 acetylase RimI-like enzyme